MNFRTMAFAAIGMVAFGTSAVSFAQPAPGPAGTPPPPPIPATTSSPLISTSAEPSALPSGALPPGSPPTSVPATTPSPDVPPTTPTPNPFASPTPDQSATPSTGGRRRRRPAAEPSPEASASETPEPPQFSTLDGVWELVLQPLTGARASYSHLYIKQDGNTITGTWNRGGKKDQPLPFSGTFDGRLFKLNVSDGGSTQTLSGYAENYMDMVGLYTDGDPKHTGVPFTADHRKSARERDRDLDKPKKQP